MIPINIDWAGCSLGHCDSHIQRFTHIADGTWAFNRSKMGKWRFAMATGLAVTPSDPPVHRYVQVPTVQNTGPGPVF